MRKVRHLFLHVRHLYMVLIYFHLIFDGQFRYLADNFIICRTILLLGGQLSDGLCFK
jgi:hypothetical protein